MEIIKLNLIPSGVNPTCHCSQYDNGRVIRIDLFDGLTPYTLKSGDVVTLNVRKPDNTIVTTTLSTTQGNKYVDLVTTEQICACVGYNLCDLTITNGSVVIGTLNFIMAVERDVLADGIPSQSVIEDLDELVAEAVGDNYYNKTETDTLLDAKADKSTTYTKSETDAALALKTDKSITDTLQISINNIEDVVSETYSDGWTQGNINSSGQNQNSTTRARTTYILVRKNEKLTIDPKTKFFKWSKYDINKNFVEGSSYSGTWRGTTDVIKNTDNDYYYRVVIRNADDTSVVDVSTIDTVITVDTVLKQELDKLNSVGSPVNADYINISSLLGWDGEILQASVNSTITLSPTDKTHYRYLALPVKSGEKLRISGVGSANSRLWLFTDTNLKVLSRSNTFASETNLVLTATSDGYFVFNANSLEAITPKVELYIKNILNYKEVKDELDETSDILFNNDILSAFSNITCCGDSLTASVVYTGETHEGGTTSYITRPAYKRYPAVLGIKTGADVTIKAVGGYSASDWWANYGSSIEQKTNQLAIIYLGTNGGLTDTLDVDAPDMDISHYANTNTGNYCKIVKSFVDVGAKVLLIHIKKTSGSIFTTNDVIDKIGDKFSVAVVDVPMLRDLKYHSYPDGTGYNSLHYNDLGYCAFADMLIKTVAKLNQTQMLRLIPN